MGLWWFLGTAELCLALSGLWSLTLFNMVPITGNFVFFLFPTTIVLRPHRQASLTLEIWNKGCFWKVFQTVLGSKETACVYASVQTFLATVFVICSFFKACSFLGLP